MKSILAFIFLSSLCFTAQVKQPSPHAGARDPAACQVDLKELNSHIKNLLIAIKIQEPYKIFDALNEVHWNGAATLDDCSKVESKQIQGVEQPGRCYRGIELMQPLLNQGIDDIIASNLTMQGVNLIKLMPSIDMVQKNCKPAAVKIPAKHTMPVAAPVDKEGDMTKCVQYLGHLSQVLVDLYIDMHSINYSAVFDHLSQALNFAELSWVQCRNQSNTFASECLHEVEEMIPTLNHTVTDIEEFNVIELLSEIQNIYPHLARSVRTCTNGQYKLPDNFLNFMLMMTLRRKVGKGAPKLALPRIFGGSKGHRIKKLPKLPRQVQNLP